MDDLDVFPSNMWKRLPDSSRGINQTPVYINTQITTELWGVEAALRHIINMAPPILLHKISAKNATVVLEVSKNPRIVIGRSPPSGNPVADIKEILEVLKTHGIHGKILR